MSNRIDFRKAQLSTKKRLSTVVEKERRENDAAARWLKSQEERFIIYDKPRKK